MNLALYLLSFEYDTQDELIEMLIKPKSFEKYTSGENYGRRKPLITDAVTFAEQVVLAPHNRWTLGTFYRIVVDVIASV